MPKVKRYWCSCCGSEVYPVTDPSQIRLPDNTPLSRVVMPVRVANCLFLSDTYYSDGTKAKHPETVGDVRNMTDTDLLKIRNLGKDTLRKIRKFASP